MGALAPKMSVAHLRVYIIESATPVLSGVIYRTFAQVFDILWSDPQHNEGCQPNGLRGAGTYFGPDVTHAFLKKYKLEFLVRSHECKQNGYERVHKDKVWKRALYKIKFISQITLVSGDTRIFSSHR